MAKVAARYRRDAGDDEEEDGGAVAMLAGTMTMGRALVCLVLELPDEETTPEDVIEAKKGEREAVIARLVDLNLEIDQLVNFAGDKLFLLLSLPEERVLQEAEARQIKVRLNEEKYGGALCPFRRELFEEEAFAKTTDECEACTALSSLQLLELTHSVVTMEPFDDGSGDAQAFDPQRLVDDGQIVAYFYLHYERSRLKLLQNWVASYLSPQPLEDIRDYFGEKVALFYTWVGFYNTMLWLPAAIGTLLSCTKVYFGTSDTPWVSMYGVFMTLWSVLVCHLWKRLEAQRRFEWDTIEFEEQEVMRVEFMKNPATLRNTHKNEVTGAVDEYYFDEGGYLPPTGRAGRCLVTFGVIFVMDGLSILLSVFIYQHAVHPLLSVEDHQTGSTVGGVLFSLTSLVLDRVFSLLIERLIQWENWTTETQHEDALIVRSCLFNVVNKYFCLVLVGFLVNHVSFMGRDLSCPDWQCMPVVHTMLMVHFVATAAMQLAETNLLPWLRKQVAEYRSNASLKKAAGQAAPTKTTMEEALEMAPFGGVFDQYSPYVFQFGYIACFTVAFPMGSLFALVTNLYQLRASAKALVADTQRPPYSCASDIGAWQGVMDTIATASVVTNSLIVGVTSHSCYFWFPQMTSLQRIWAVIILEHLLFAAKVFLENIIPIDDVRAKREYEKKAGLRERHLRETFNMAAD
uniref:Anoctamin transmembrane domain-containing protein n=1 Tax=Hemiselmis tepida TaxID=464990 RepID=A0A7S0YXI9_9CRYP|mmetsp:Transcript_21444/g.54019  ORF Transcript_21444/g.54019 Transcript_21444/m.54019 type:complete len:687 (+) Transcript_21444:52-2112(+)